MTEPEPINHNELKRLLVEVLNDVVSTLYLPGQHSALAVERLVQRNTHKIETAILDGDDS